MNVVSRRRIAGPVPGIFAVKDERQAISVPSGVGVSDTSAR